MVWTRYHARCFPIRPPSESELLHHVVALEARKALVSDCHFTTILAYFWCCCFFSVVLLVFIVALFIPARVLLRFACSLSLTLSHSDFLSLSHYFLSLSCRNSLLPLLVPVAAGEGEGMTNVSMGMNRIIESVHMTIFELYSYAPECCMSKRIRGRNV